VAWLQDNGFQVDEIGRGRRTLEFSGTASQVERAFHTEMRQYEVNGVASCGQRHGSVHPRSPGAGDRRRGQLARFPPPADAPRAGPGARAHPATNLNGGAHGLSPYDFAAIYNVAPPVESNWDGTGQSVAIAGRTNIKLSDVTLFRSTFGLPVNNPQSILNGTDPGIISSGEEMEADLDVEWSGGVAKGAAIKFVVSASTNASDGVDLSNQYIVNNNLAPVMSVSFGACEAPWAAGNAVLQRAVAAGRRAGHLGLRLGGRFRLGGLRQSGLAAPASHGLGVNGLASTPYNVAVGGTQFADTANPAAYWNTANDAHLASAKGYIPETTWNESSYTAASRHQQQSLCGQRRRELDLRRPSWQTGAGVPTVDPGTTTGHHRYLPDVSLTAAGHDGYLVYPGRRPLPGGRDLGILALLRRTDGHRRSVHRRPQRQPEYAFLFAGGAGPRHTTTSPAAPSRCPARAVRPGAPRPRGRSAK
jgi:pseudomonalisin